MASYTGSNLSAKKKEELSSIAAALGLPADGLRDTLLRTIKVHLTENEETLSQEPRFAGLYAGRRRRGVATKKALITSGPSSEEEDEEEVPTAAGSRRASSQLISPEEVPLPASGPSTPMQARVIEALIDKAEAAEAAQTMGVAAEILSPEEERTVIVATSGSDVVIATVQSTPYVYRDLIRDYLSDSSVIAGLTIFIELLWFLSTVVPVTYSHVPAPFFRQPPPLAPEQGGPLVVPGFDVPIPHPSIATFNHVVSWSLPTLIIPQLAGALISFSRPKKHVDPLTAAIVRLAAVWASGDAGGVPMQARIAGAAVNLAFAYAHAIYESGAAGNTVVY